MKPLLRPLAAGLSLLSMMAAIGVAHAQKPAPAKPVPYAKVETILKAKCVGCHQGAAPAAMVDLSSYDKVMKAKYKGKPVVVAKKAKDSVLSKAVHGTGMMKMPPGAPLTAADMATIDAWIAAGAKK